jgi:hypothetical protein
MKLLSVFLPVRLFLIAGLSSGLLGVLLAQESKSAEVQDKVEKVKNHKSQVTSHKLAQNSQPALTRVTGVEVNQTTNGLELVLKTAAGSEKLVPLILPEGNDLVIDILDATLAFSIRNGVRESNPAPGIRSVALTKVDNSSIRLTITGEKQAPSAEVMPSNQNLVLSINPQETTARQTPDEEIEIIATGEGEEEGYDVPNASTATRTDTLFAYRCCSLLLVPQAITKSPNANWKQYTQFLATALGKKDKVQQLLAKYDRRIEELKIALGDRYSNQTISVAQVNDEYGTEAYTVNSFPGSILSDLGLQRPQSQAISKPGGTIEAISEERLELIDGDLLFMLTFSDRDRQTLENLLQKPLWKKLKAVQNGQVYSVDGWTWVVANPLAADAVINDIYKYLVNTP